MSSYGTGSMPDVVRGGGGPISAPLQRITGTLDAPGVAAPRQAGPSDGYKLASEMASAITGVANIIQIRGEQAERAKRLQEIEDNKARLQWEGRADLRAAELLPQIRSKIASGEILPSEAEDGIAEQTATLSDTYANESGFPQAYRDRLRERLTGNVNEWLTVARDGRIAQMTAEADSAWSVRLDTETSPEGIQAILGEAQGIRGSGTTIGPSGTMRRGGGTFSRPDQVIDTVLYPAAKRAAEAGNAEQYERLSALLPDRFATEKLGMAAQVQRSVAERRRNTEVQGQEAVFGAINRAERGNGTFDEAYRILNDVSDRKVLDEQTSLTMRTHIDARKNAAQAKINEGLDNLAYTTQMRQITDSARLWMKDGGTTGGAASLPDEFTIALPSGKTKTVKSAEVSSAITSEQFATLDQETARMAQSIQSDPTLDNAQKFSAGQRLAADNFARKVDFLAQQGGGTVYDPWKADLNAAFTQASTAAVSGQASPSTVRAFDLYTRMVQSESTGVMNDHLTDENSRNFLRTVSLIQKHTRGLAGAPGGGGMTTEQAIVAAARIESGRAFSSNFRRNIDPQLLAERANELASSLGADNVESLRTVLADKAEMYKIMSGVSDETALAQAVEDSMQDFAAVDGSAAFTRGRMVPPNMNAEIVPLVKGSWLEQHGDRKGATTENVRLTLDGRTGLYRITDRFGSTVADSPILSQGDVTEFNRWTASVEAAKELLRRGSAQGRGSFLGGMFAGLVGGPTVPDAQPLAKAQLDALTANLKASLKPSDEVSDDMRAIMDYWLRQNKITAKDIDEWPARIDEARKAASAPLPSTNRPSFGQGTDL